MEERFASFGTVNKQTSKDCGSSKPSSGTLLQTSECSTALTSPYYRYGRLFATRVTQLKMHYFSGGAFESLISSQLLKKEKYI